MSLTATLLEPEHLEDVNFSIEYVTEYFKKDYRLEYVETFLGVINTAMQTHARTVGISVTLKTSTSQNNENIMQVFIRHFKTQLSERLNAKFNEAQEKYEHKKEQIKNGENVELTEPPKPEHFKSDVNYFFVGRIESELKSYALAKSLNYTGFIFVNKDCFNPPKPWPSKIESVSTIELHVIVAKCWKDTHVELGNGTKENFTASDLNVSYYLLNRNNPHIVKYMAQTLVKACDYVKLEDKQFKLLDAPENDCVINSNITAPFPDEIKNRFIKLCIKYQSLENTTFKGGKGEYVEGKSKVRVIHANKRKNGVKVKKLLLLENIRVDENMIIGYLKGATK